MFMKRMRIAAVVMMALVFACIVAGNIKSCEWGEESDEVPICDVLDYDEEILGTESVDTIIEYVGTYHYEPPVIPSFVEDLLEYAEWGAETICVTNGKAYMLASETYGRLRVIYDDKRVLVADPALFVESVEDESRDGKFHIRVMDKSRMVDISDANSLKGLKALSRKLPTFWRHRKDSIREKRQTVFYGLAVDYPKSAVSHADRIKRWVDKKIEESDYMGQISPSDSDDAYCPSCIFSTLSLQARYMNNRFVTYQQFTFDYEGGAHGMYTERLLSYDYVHGKEIDFNYLFLPRYKKQLLNLVIEAAIQHPSYEHWKPDVMEYAEMIDNDGEATGYIRLPQPGLPEEGVMFSFQPYEICCFAAGTFHFTIPYKKSGTISDREREMVPGYMICVV
jgi:hypothetical protein